MLAKTTTYFLFFFPLWVTGYFDETYWLCRGVFPWLMEELPERQWLEFLGQILDAYFLLLPFFLFLFIRRVVVTAARDDGSRALGRVCYASQKL